MIEGIPDQYEKVVLNRPNAVSINGAVCTHEGKTNFKVGDYKKTDWLYNLTEGSEQCQELQKI